MSKKDLEELQLKRLRYIIKYVAERTPYYIRKFKDAGVTPDDLVSLRDIRKFPYTTKEDLLKYGYPYGNDFLAVPMEDLIGWHYTSGTTGRPTPGPYTLRDLDTWSNLMARVYITAGVRKGDIVMNNYGYGLFTGGLGFHYGAIKIGAKVIPWGAGRTEALVDFIQTVKPTVMVGTPSYLLYIMETLQRKGVDTEKLPVRILIPGAEMWTESTREKLEAGFALKEKGGGARNIYGTTELLGPGAGIECEEERGFHFWVDHDYLELEDPETREPVSEGEEGEMVVTTLTKEAMPLIRYRMRDLTKIRTDGECECGRVAFPRLDFIHGRIDDVIHYKGAKIMPSAIQEVIFKFPEIKEYQVIIDRSTEHAEFTVKIEVAKNAEDQIPTLRKVLLDELSKALVFLTPKLEVVPEGTLPRYEGKAKRVIVMGGV
jgi:phenylacetate-CoA ligase